MARPLFGQRKLRRSRLNERQLEFRLLENRTLLAADFLSFGVSDASQDSTSQTVFESSALQVNYNLSVASGTTLTGVDLFTRDATETYKLGEYTSVSSNNLLVNLDGFADLTGQQEIFAKSYTSDGATRLSNSIFIDVLPTTTFTGDFSAETFSFNGSSGTGTVYQASGGSDTLNLNIPRSSVVDFNGESILSYDANAFVDSQAFYQGSVFDYLTLNNGREIYLQGVDVLSFSDATVKLQTTPNDPWFDRQWEVSIGDVGDAWRFTRGSDDVLLVSLDTGVPIANGQVTTSDLELARHEFETGTSNGGTHGHRATSVMSAEANNNHGHAGINWESPVLVIDVYGGSGTLSFNEAIQAGLDELDVSSASRVVFQGGIQGEYWLNILDESLIANSQDRALFAVAAGNGSQDISLTTNSGYSGGVARLEGDYDNVWAIGALINGGVTEVHGINNANNPGLASYSNFGANLTFTLPTNTPSVSPNGDSSLFSGTSNSNPVMAAYTSLVWSVNPGLSPAEVTDIYVESIMDLGDAGRDETFGHGVPHVGSAVRRAWTMAENPGMAFLDDNAFADDDPIDGDPIGEAGEISDLTHVWQTVNLTESFVDPVVIFGPLSNNGPDPSTVQVRNVTATSFEVRIHEYNYLNGVHNSAESVGYVVVEAGTHTLSDGTVLKAGTAEIRHQWQSVSFDTSFDSTPVVFSQTMTDNGADTIVTRQNNVGSNGFDLRVQEEEGGNGLHVFETVGWLAIEQASGTSNGNLYEAGNTGDSVTHNDYSLTFSSGFGSSPIFLAAMQSFDGADTATIRYNSLSGADATIFIADERSKDNEVNHTTETVGYFAFELGTLFGRPGNQAERLIAVDQSSEFERTEFKISDFESSELDRSSLYFEDPMPAVDLSGRMVSRFQFVYGAQTTDFKVPMDDVFEANDRNTEMTVEFSDLVGSDEILSGDRTIDEFTKTLDAVFDAEEGNDDPAFELFELALL